MKNMIAFFIGMILLFSFSFLLPSNFNFENYQKVVLVSDEKLGEDCVQCGNEYFCTFTNDKWKDYQKDSRAMIFYFDEFDFSSFSRDCDEIYACENIDNIKVYEGYNKTFHKSENVNNKKVNFQLAITENGVILGFPMIVVGF